LASSLNKAQEIWASPADSEFHNSRAIVRVQRLNGCHQGFSFRLAGLTEHQHFRALLARALPLIVGFDARHDIAAGGQLLIE
jgi:hypothetical protein